MATTVSERIAAIRSRVDLPSEGALLVSYPADVRWCTGFTGSNGCLLIFADEELLITDGRYTHQAAIECPEIQVRIHPGSAIRAATDMLDERPVSTVLVQADRVSWSEVQHIRLTVPTAEVIAVEDPFPEMRASKTAHELSAIGMALEMSEAVFNGVLNMIREGVTEKDIASEIDHQHRLRGASGPAFDTIVAFSENAALPHARPSERALKKGDIILMDFGGIVDGYHSDITRTVSFGRADKEFLEAYQAVKQSLEAATEYAEAGVQGVTLDRVARDVLTRHGYGARFTHSLGHGVGLEIHEYPSVSQRNPSPLPMDCVVTLEPGVYLEGHFGIRIENMVHLRKGTCDTLNSLSTDLVVL